MVCVAARFPTIPKFSQPITTFSTFFIIEFDR
jgi:hypothetical protein